MKLLSISTGNTSMKNIPYYFLPSSFAPNQVWGETLGPEFHTSNFYVEDNFETVRSVKLIYMTRLESFDS